MTAVDEETAVLGPGWPRMVARVGREAAARARLVAEAYPDLSSRDDKLGFTEEARKRTIAVLWESAHQGQALN